MNVPPVQTFTIVTEEVKRLNDPQRHYMIISNDCHSGYRAKVSKMSKGIN